MGNIYTFCFNYYVVTESENEINYFEVVGKDQNSITVTYYKNDKIKDTVLSETLVLETHVIDNIEFVVIDGKKVFANKYYYPAVSVLVSL